MYKRIKQQIADQTRTPLGFVKVDQARGYDITKSPTESVQLPETTPLFVWSKWSFIRDQAISRPQPSGFCGPVPVRDINLYHDKYPNYQYLVHYFQFIIPWKITQSSKITSQSKGSFEDSNLPINYNALYAIEVEKNYSTSQFEKVPIRISGNKIACSIWYIDRTIYDWSSPEAPFVEKTHILYSSLYDGLNGEVYLEIPIKNKKTTFMIFVYTNEEGKYFKLDTDFKYSNPVKRTEKVDAYATLLPQWGNVPIITSADPISGNITNTLYFKKSSNVQSGNLMIFRREYNSDNILYSYLDNNSFYNNILLDTSDNNPFTDNEPIYIANKEEQIKGTLYCYANKIKNPDFSSYTGSSINYWLKTATSSGAISNLVCTSYPYRGECVTNGNSFKMHCYKTSTTKSYYIESSAVAVDTSDYLSIWHKPLTTKDIGALKFIYYSSSNGTLSVVSSALYQYLNKFSIHPQDYSTSPYAANSWLNIKRKFNYTLYSTAENDNFYLPYDAKYLKVRLYSSYRSTSASIRLIDSFHIGDIGADYIFHTSKSDKIAIQLTNKFEKPVNTYSSYYNHFLSTSKSDNGISVSSTFGNYQLVNSSVRNNCRFDYGVKLVDYARNYVANGDFRGGIRFWSTSNGFYYSTVHGKSLYHNDFYTRFYGNNGRSYIKQSTSQPGLVGSSCFALAIWAKSYISGQQMKLSLENTRNMTSSSYFTLSTSWSKYEVYNKFASGGSTVIARIIASASPYWSIDIAGVQVEANQHIPDFNYLTTVQGTANIRAYQGLKYRSSGIIDHSFGTVRMWYSPLMDSRNLRQHTAKSTTPYFQGLFYCGNNDNNYKSIYWDYNNRAFCFRQKNGSNQYTAYVSTSGYYAQDSLVHIVATWDSGHSYLYVNTNRSTSNCLTISTTNASTCYIGHYAPCMATALNAPNGIISGFRIDKFTWSYNDVKNDYYAIKQPYNNNSVIKYVDQKHIGTRSLDNYNKNVFTFVDDNGLENNKTYYYVFAMADENNNLSQFSEEQSILTNRKPFEKTFVNKVLNSSFEIVDNNTHKVLYWDSAGSVPEGTQVNESHFFNGNRSIQSSLNSRILSQYISILDTTVPHYFSFYYRSGYSLSAVNPYALVYFYDKKWNNIGRRQYFYTPLTKNFSTCGSIGADGDYWVRFGTSIGKSNLSYSTVISTKYWVVELCSLNLVGYFDAIQVEETDWRSYCESPFIKDGNIGSNSIDGNAVAFDTLVGQHLYAGELIISRHTSDANRIIIGEEKYDSAFVEMTPNYLKYHPPYTATTEGFKFAKHIEYGFEKYGNQVNFVNRFLGPYGDVKTPNLIISPASLVTFSTVWMPSAYAKASVYPQKLFFSKNATAGGFIANASLVKVPPNKQQTNLIFYLSTPVGGGQVRFLGHWSGDSDEGLPY